MVLMYTSPWEVAATLPMTVDIFTRDIGHRGWDGLLLFSLNFGMLEEERTDQSLGTILCRAAVLLHLGFLDWPSYSSPAINCAAILFFS